MTRNRAHEPRFDPIRAETDYRAEQLCRARIRTSRRTPRRPRWPRRAARAARA
ncbi:hypothetical protein [Prauserella alba]|uniref:Uncharacterized protein n=1 Tax=Prauserella alba TaxID=176898 RepID=A0ABP4GG43_9PSEU|nr:hypothetical protein [Prauserella alba]MCP2179875.1 hypothetical protein [Prauserella alba]